MIFASICSGIESASVAWLPLGWECAFTAEIEPFPCAVLKHHYPDVPNLGDITRFAEWPDAAFDVLVGGTPCQSFSVAGLRKGLADPRGNLALTYLAIADRFRPCWLLWENVPGVLSSNGGRDFGAFLGGLEQLGYGWAYRVLDAQHVRVDGLERAVPQRRRRVFVVGYLGDWRRAAAVLFERESLFGHSPPRREKGEGVAGPLGGSSQDGGFRTTDLDNQGAYIPEIVPQAMSRKWSKQSSGPAGDEVANLVAHSLRASGFDASEDGTERGTPFIAFAQNTRDEVRQIGGDGSIDGSIAAETGMKQQSYILHGSDKTVSTATPTDIAGSVRTKPPGSIENSSTTAVLQNWAVRRLTPTECERLQGFPDDYLTSVTWRGKGPPPDGPMYKALGNSMAVNCVRWIGMRIAMADQASDEAAA